MGNADCAALWVRACKKIHFEKRSTLNITNPFRRVEKVQNIPAHGSAALALR
jgi:hypothetical protein